jgi:demethylmenaquinone methyltransferase/2-methoxy-6-polyprenyl-1,4-benzoquinol methylase
MQSARPGFARALFSGIAGRYETMGRAMSLGQEPRWRRFLVSRLAVGPEDRVLDVATGTGLVAREIVRQHGCHVTGLDQSPEMLAVGAAANRAAGMERSIDLACGGAEELPFPDGAFDAVSFTYLLRYVAEPEAVLAELTRVLRPGGVLASLEFAVPPDPLTRQGWRLYTRLGLPAIGALASPAWRDTGRFLGPNIEEFHRRWPLAIQARLWHEAGLRRLAARRFTLGAAVVVWGVKRGMP